MPDPLADSAAGILRHMNADHGEALVLLARAAGEAGAEAAITSASMTAVDRLGFQLRLRSGDRVHGARIAFPREVRNSGDVRDVLVEMVRAARDAG
jgi:putative heme iron utilization protein